MTHTPTPWEVKLHPESDFADAVANSNGVKTNGHLLGWRVSVGDEHAVFDGENRKLVNVPCGGMTNRTFEQAAECAALIALAPKLLAELERCADWFAAGGTEPDAESLRALISQVRKA